MVTSFKIDSHEDVQFPGAKSKGELCEKQRRFSSPKVQSDLPSQRLCFTPSAQPTMMFCFLGLLSFDLVHPVV